jgi:nucleoside-diphosphate-sugar epimerase
MKVLVFGASGFVGQHLVEGLKKNNFEVIALSRRDCDASNLDQVVQVFTKFDPDFVFNLASLNDPGRQLDNFKEQIDASILPSVAIARGVSPRVRLCLFFGSIEEYGHNTPPFTEDMKADPISVYGWGKSSAFSAVQLICNLRKVRYTWIRPSLLFGPGMSKSRFLGQVIDACYQDRELKLTDCQQKRDFLFIDDLIQMLLRILREPEKVEQKVLNLCSGAPKKLDEVAELVRSKIGRGNLIFGSIPYRKDEMMEFYSSPERFLSLYGDFSFTSFDVALEKTIRDWQL